MGAGERESIAAITQVLQDVLGQRLLAYTTEVRSAQAIGSWAAGEATPRAGADQRLRALYQTVLILREAGLSRHTIRAWLQGANPDLGERAPIELLRQGRDTAVLHAAENFTH